MAFPNNENAPTEGAQPFKVFHVPLLIPLEFRKPIGSPGFWNVRVDATLVLVPEATSNFDDLS